MMIPDLPLFIIFVTIADGIRSIQPLGKVHHQDDDAYLQFVLCGVDFTEILKLFPGEGETDIEEDEEETEG